MKFTQYKVANIVKSIQKNVSASRFFIKKCGFIMHISKISNTFISIAIFATLILISQPSNAEVPCPTIEFDNPKLQSSPLTALLINEDTGTCHLVASADYEKTNQTYDNGAYIQLHTENDTKLWVLNSKKVNGQNSRVKTSSCKGRGCERWPRGDYVLCNPANGHCTGRFNYAGKNGDKIYIEYEILKDEHSLRSARVTGGNFGPYGAGTAAVHCPDIPFSNPKPQTLVPHSILVNDDNGTCRLSPEPLPAKHDQLNGAYIQVHTERDTTLWILNSQKRQGKAVRVANSTCAGKGCSAWPRGDYVVCDPARGDCLGEFSYKNSDGSPVWVRYEVHKNDYTVRNITVFGGTFDHHQNSCELRSTFEKNLTSSVCLARPHPRRGQVLGTQKPIVVNQRMTFVWPKIPGNLEDCPDNSQLLSDKVAKRDVGALCALLGRKNIDGGVLADNNVIDRPDHFGYAGGCRFRKKRAGEQLPGICVNDGALNTPIITIPPSEIIGSLIQKVIIEHASYAFFDTTAGMAAMDSIDVESFKRNKCYPVRKIANANVAACSILNQMTDEDISAIAPSSSCSALKLRGHGKGQNNVLFTQPKRTVSTWAERYIRWRADAGTNPKNNRQWMFSPVFALNANFFSVPDTSVCGQMLGNFMSHDGTYSNTSAADFDTLVISSDGSRVNTFEFHARDILTGKSSFQDPREQQIGLLDKNRKTAIISGYLLRYNGRNRWMYVPETDKYAYDPSWSVGHPDALKARTAIGYDPIKDEMLIIVYAANRKLKTTEGMTIPELSSEFPDNYTTVLALDGGGSSGIQRMFGNSFNFGVGHNRRLPGAFIFSAQAPADYFSD